MTYSQRGEIPKAVRDALAKAVAFKQAAVETQRQITEHDQQVSTLTRRPERIRENLKSVDRTTSYATRLLKKLDDQESQIDKLRNETEGSAYKTRRPEPRSAKLSQRAQRGVALRHPNADGC